LNRNIYFKQWEFMLEFIAGLNNGFKKKAGATILAPPKYFGSSEGRLNQQEKHSEAISMIAPAEEILQYFL